MKTFIRALAAALLIAIPSSYAQESSPIAFTGFPLYAKAITPNDGADLTNWVGNPANQYVYVSVTGNVVVVPAGNSTGNTITFTGVPAGTFVPVMCRRVLATGTTATGLIGVF